MESSYVYKSSQEIAKELKEVFDANNAIDEQAGEEWPHSPKPQLMRMFSTGATRNTADGKPDYAGFLSPNAIKRFGEYMMKHQVQADGSLRSSSNWKKGIPLDAYMSSLFRHVIDYWAAYETKFNTSEELEELLCAIMFNAQGALHETLREKVHAKLPDVR